MHCETHFSYNSKVHEQFIRIRRANLQSAKVYPNMWVPTSTLTLTYFFELEELYPLHAVRNIYFFIFVNSSTRHHTTCAQTCDSPTYTLSTNCYVIRPLDTCTACNYGCCIVGCNAFLQLNSLLTTTVPAPVRR